MINFSTSLLVLSHGVARLDLSQSHDQQFLRPASNSMNGRRSWCENLSIDAQVNTSENGGLGRNCQTVWAAPECLIWRIIVILKWHGTIVSIDLSGKVWQLCLSFDRSHKLGKNELEWMIIRGNSAIFVQVLNKRISRALQTLYRIIIVNELLSISKARSLL